MMISTSVFEKIGALVSAAKARELKDHAAFLAFYRQLVEALPSEVTKAFGSMDVKASGGGEGKSWVVRLTATDFMSWKLAIEDEGFRLVPSPAAVQRDMLNHLSKKAEIDGLEPKERKALLALLDEAAGA